MLIGDVGLNSIANQTAQQGYSAAHAASKEASRNLSVSNFGSETKAGSSKFQQSNEVAAREGNRATAEKMQETRGRRLQNHSRRACHHYITFRSVPLPRLSESVPRRKRL